MKFISSESNPQFKVWQQLAESKGIKKHQLCLVSGRKLVPELLHSRADHVHALLFSEEHQETPLFLADPPASSQKFSLQKNLFKQLDLMGTRAPLLIMRLPQVEAWRAQDVPQGLELFIALGDPANLGAVLRSAEAFDAQRVILLSEAASPFLPKSIRASAGAIFRLPLFHGPSIADLNGEFIVLDKTGTTLNEFRFPKNARLLLGEEGQGIPAQLKGAQKVTIPMAQDTESLNAVVAASIVLYHAAHVSRN